MTGKPLVSVLVPTYNQERFVGETLNSLLAQDYTPMQIVVRDDGSSDATPRIVREYADRHPERILLLEGGRNLGIAGNCNAILRACTGRYIALFAGDDVSLPGKLSTQVEWLEGDERRVFCHHDVETFESATGRTLYLYSQRHPLRGGSAADLVRHPAFCAGPSVMVRRSAIPAEGYDTRIRVASDWLFFMETILSSGIDTPSAGVVPGVYARYRRHEHNATNDADLYGLAEGLLGYQILAARAPALRTQIARASSERLATYGFRRVLSGSFVSGTHLVLRSLWQSPIGLARSLMNAARYYTTAPRAARARR